MRPIRIEELEYDKSRTDSEIYINEAEKNKKFNPYVYNVLYIFSGKITN